jgi:hypothetical protein
MSETLNINDIINLVKESNKEFESDLFLPSLKKDVHFKPMNASHLKSIIKTSVEGVFANNMFNQTLFAIIKDVIDSSIPLSSITTIDKIYILLQLRKMNVKNKISVEFKNGETTKVVEEDLDKIISKLKKKKLDFSFQTLDDGPYSLTIGLPTIDQEFISDRYFEQTKIKKIDEKDKNALKDLLAPLFISEITQYIKVLKIKEQEINFLSLPISERLAIVETLSTNIISKIIEKIDESFGKQINEILKIEKEIDGEKYIGKIELNANLFT